MRKVLYYNPMIKDTNYHYKYIGRKGNGETWKIRSVLPRRRLIHGSFIPIMKIVNASGIEEMLRKHHTGNESMQITTMAVSKVVRTLPAGSL
jgi:hypothetical protein